MRLFIGIAAVMVLALGLHTGTVATAAADPAAATSDHEQQRHHRHKHGNPMASPAHRAMYMQLLAERYTPEASGAWKQTMAERASIMKELHGIRTAEKWDRNETQEKMKQFMNAQGDSIKAQRKLMSEFTAAVQSGEEERIKEVLPKLLQAEQAMNAALNKWAKSEKSRKK
jgi:hypothetical protein